MLTLVLALAVSAAAVTEPGTLAAPAQLRAEPRAEAMVIGRASAGEAVQVDLRPVNGYCRVTTAGGVSGFVPLEVVNLASPAAAPEDLRAPTPRPASHDEALASSVRASAPMHVKLTRGQSVGATVALASIGIGASILAGNLFRDRASTSWQESRNTAAVGLGIMGLGSLIGLAIMPDQDSVVVEPLY